MSVMHLLVDWAQLRKESLSLKKHKEKILKLTVKRREREKKKNEVKYFINVE